MFGASYTLKRNEHVRVDLIYMTLSRRGQLWIDILGTLVFLLPTCIILAWLSWPFFMQSFTVSEHSSNAGGLLRWPIKLVPAGRLRAAGAAGPVRADQARGLPQRLSRRKSRSALREAARNDHSSRVDAAADVRRPGRLHDHRLPGGLLAGRRRASSSASCRSTSATSPCPSCRPFPAACSAASCRNELLLAIPFFTFMGAILEKCGLAEDMLESMGQLFGPVRGGLGYSTIIVGFILGAITGTVAAQVIAMAMITLPVMMRYKYDMRYATGVLAASGTITQLVPPSLVLVVLADQLGRSVGDMYARRLGPIASCRSPCSPPTPSICRIVQARGAAAGAAHAVRQGAADQVRLGHHPRRWC